MERTYTPSFHSVKFYSPEEGYIPNITLNIETAPVFGFIDLANAHPETINGIEVMRDTRPAGQNSSIMANAVEFKRGKYYYYVVATYDSNPGSANSSDKTALQDFNNMLSSFHFSN